jgi:hypothetical protein
MHESKELALVTIKAMVHAQARCAQCNTKLKTDDDSEFGVYKVQEPCVHI